MTINIHVYNFNCDKKLYKCGVEAIKSELIKYNKASQLIDQKTHYIDAFGKYKVNELCDYAINNCFKDNNNPAYDEKPIDSFLRHFMQLHRIYLIRDEIGLTNIKRDWNKLILKKNITSGGTDLISFIKKANKIGSSTRVIVLTSDPRIDKYTGSTDLNRSACIVTSAEFRFVYDKKLEDTFVTDVLHEFGHLCGLPRQDRNKHGIDTSHYGDEVLYNLERQFCNDIAHSYGWHCLDKCVMRQRCYFPSWYSNLTIDRLHSRDPYCESCRTEMDKFMDTISNTEQQYPRSSLGLHILLNPRE